MKIESCKVYVNDEGEQRLVVSIERNTTTNNHVVIWRTATTLLPKGIKSQGSATLASFIKWPTSMRESTPEDWKAFSMVETMRKEFAQAKKKIKNRKGK